MRIIYWLLYNGCMAALLYFGFFAGVQGAQNVVQFVAWFVAIGSLLLMSEPSIAVGVKDYNQSWHVPQIFSVGVNIMVVFVFAWHDWFWTALAYAVQTLILVGYRQTVREAAETEKEKTCS